ncbi:osomolarity two-component response regulator ssk1 [Colletotrichum truncatum]|uniref:Osomolarity two-component response regulator ssk1 n=1 Tax=Colletotrichum truncatum TaxID=5467 RepID=A0ACC3Z198_COLTU|nr:osomolarity two-component response regulator ssk1 [Colletotrichum truncatum]KAF6788979.1 osomolarity two-component response regulator ssk1 [Colletotrichum truncatum]
MGAAGDIRARLRAKFSRRNSAAPSLASTNGDAHSSQPDATSLTRQSSAAATASSSQNHNLHQPHHQPQPQSQPQTPCPSSPEPGVDHLSQQRLQAITVTRADVPHDQDNHEELPPSPSPHRQSEQQQQQPCYGDQSSPSNDSRAPCSNTFFVTDDSTGTTHGHRPGNPRVDPDMETDAHKPHPNADSASSVPPATPDQRLASELEASGNDLHSSTTTTTAANSNLPSINEDQTLPAGALSQLSAPTRKEQDLQSSQLVPQQLPPKFGATPTVVLEADLAHRRDLEHLDPLNHAIGTPTPLASNLIPISPLSPRPDGPPRRQSLLPNRQTTLIRTLLDAAQANHEVDSSIAESLLPINGNMVTRKVWVRRPGASPTLITINEDDLVDDVRDFILRKYANSLGRHFDSPDLTLRICPREQRQDRLLGPEEPMGRTLDAYFPGGQTVDEALVIDIPSRRTPRPSPRAPPHATTVYYTEDGRPSEAGEGYFPPVGALPSPNLPVPVIPPVNTVPVHPVHTAHAHMPHAHSIAVLGTGQIPPIPSPGGTRSRAYRERPERPRLGRTHTSSPTILNTANAQSMAAAAATTSHPSHSFHPRLPPSRTHSNTSEPSVIPPAAPPLPTPPAPEVQQVQRVATPPPRVASPRPASSRPKKTKKNMDHPTLPAGILNGGVPPINVLIVEDNPINLKLLEAFVKRLKVRWKTAINGRDAVSMWRTGGFHLVLMDIQLPVMNGLDATREIRRLERVNSIGVFSSSASSVPELTSGELEEKDRLHNMELFKSPVIIVALTASSLQSDRHEALAAGCNDFLTKPVNFVWLERKVMEWGCMQALIDFDGWRRWKDFSQQNDETDAAKKSATLKTKAKKNRLSMTSVPA